MFGPAQKPSIFSTQDQQHPNPRDPVMPILEVKEILEFS